MGSQKNNILTLLFSLLGVTVKFFEDFSDYKPLPDEANLCVCDVPTSGLETAYKIISSMIPKSKKYDLTNREFPEYFLYSFCVEKP